MKNHPPTTVNVSNENFLMNTSLYNKNYSSKQVDSCTEPDSDQLILKTCEVSSTNQYSDNETVKSTSLKIRKTSNEKSEKLMTTNNIKVTSSTPKNTTENILINDSSTSLNSFDQNGQRETDTSENNSSITSQSCLYYLLLRPKLHIEETLRAESNSSLSNPPVICESAPAPISAPAPAPAPNTAPRLVSLSMEEINYYKKRETELNHTAKELIKGLKAKTDETINQISEYWSFFKQCSLDQITEKTTHNQLFDYLFKSFNSHKEIKDYLEEHDEVKAALQVLSTALLIVRDKYSLLELNQMFDYEKETIIEYLGCASEALLSSYYEELSIIHECSLVYQNSLNNDKIVHWIETIKNDYPSLIRKLSDDYINRTPQMERILLKMLLNLKQRLFDKKRESYE